MSSATVISARQHTVESEMEMPSTRVRQKMKRHTTMKAATFHSGPHEPCAPVHHTSPMGEVPVLPVAYVSLEPDPSPAGEMTLLPAAYVSPESAPASVDSPVFKLEMRKLARCKARIETRGKTATGMATIWAGT